jgi:hypothetical protein
VEKAFDFVADERNEPRYNSRMLRADEDLAGADRAGDPVPRRLRLERPTRIGRRQEQATRASLERFLEEQATPQA